MIDLAKDRKDGAYMDNPADAWMVFRDNVQFYSAFKEAV